MICQAWTTPVVASQVGNMDGVSQYGLFFVVGVV